MAACAYKQNEAQHFQDAKVILKLFVKGKAHTDTRKVKMPIFVLMPLLQLELHATNWCLAIQIGKNFLTFCISHYSNS